VLTKLTGDARGGGAFDASGHGKPIRFAGVGEKLDDLDRSMPNGWQGESSNG